VDDRSYKLKTPPVIEPIGLEEFKLTAGIVSDEWDPILAGRLKAARQGAEDYTRRAFIEQTWVLSIDAWPKVGNLELPRPPLASITEIRTLDEDGNETVVSSSLYYTDTRIEPGVVYLKSGAAITPGRSHRGIEVEFKAGYGLKATDVDEQLRTALIDAAVLMWEERAQELTENGMGLLFPYKVIET
jgi:uncharacterized phiE125 gp8 family phage protein